MVFNYLQHYKHFEGMGYFFVMLIELLQHDIVAIVKK